MTTPPAEDVLVEALRAADSRTAGAAQAVVARLIREGSLVPGTRLPTIRDLAQRSGLSTRAVVAAWSGLRSDGLIETNRRGGTVIAQLESLRGGAVSWSDRDLLTSSPDYALQPDLATAMLAGLQTDQINRPGRAYITDRLREVVVDGWPFAAEAFAAAGGGSEGLLLAVEAAAPAGALIAVEEPVMPGFLDTLTEVGYSVVGVASDEHGAIAESLAAALAREPAVVVLQPEGAYSAAGTLTSDRARELAGTLDAAAYVGWIVEDDAVGPLARAQAPSLGSYFPERTVRVRSYCKAFGMDIKTCVIGGSAELVDRAINTRVHGISANSRILQDALAHLVTDPDAAALVDTARACYEWRRTGLVSALAERGAVAHSGPNSLVVWVEVKNETGTLIELARKGIVVGAGSKSHVAPKRSGLLRVAVPQLPDDRGLLGELADALAEEAGSTHRERLE
ncbi:MAG: aminotransferase class I/II-fold pyridoxal phosphate-dependent enzyme [Rhodococcus sp. (in: high G+C Gram-positive bacteria)]